MADIFKENISEAAANEMSKASTSSEGMVVAYGSLVVMALLPIFVGSFRSIKHLSKKDDEVDIRKKEMSNKDAAIFPLIASATLFGLYIIFQIFSKEYINLLLAFYFFSLGVTSLCHLVSPSFSKLIPYIPKIPYHFHFTQGGPKGTEVLADQHFSSHDVICFICCTIFGGWYLLKKHWIANNILGIAFATNGVELLHLNNVVTGCILLCGLFVYDIFWVFGTNVMVTVAKSFEAPIKLVFPQDLLERGLGASNFAMLGLGDIVVPGIFIALLLRFDNSLKRNSKTYFYTSLLAYTSGLMATILVMHVSKRAQPALLYLVPTCLGTPILLAVLKGDLKDMLKYEDSPSDEKGEKAGEKEGEETGESRKESNKKKN